MQTNTDEKPLPKNKKADKNKRKKLNRKAREKSAQTQPPEERENIAESIALYNFLSLDINFVRPSEMVKTRLKELKEHLLQMAEKVYLSDLEHDLQDFCHELETLINQPHDPQSLLDRCNILYHLCKNIGAGFLPNSENENITFSYRFYDFANKCFSGEKKPPQFLQEYNDIKAQYKTYMEDLDALETKDWSSAAFRLGKKLLTQHGYLAAVATTDRQYMPKLIQSTPVSLVIETEIKIKIIISRSTNLLPPPSACSHYFPTMLLVNVYSHDKFEKKYRLHALKLLQQARKNEPDYFLADFLHAKFLLSLGGADRPEGIKYVISSGKKLIDNKKPKYISNDQDIEAKSLYHFLSFFQDIPNEMKDIIPALHDYAKTSEDFNNIICCDLCEKAVKNILDSTKNNKNNKKRTNTKKKDQSSATYEEKKPVEEANPEEESKDVEVTYPVVSFTADKKKQKRIIFVDHSSDSFTTDMSYMSQNQFTEFFKGRASLFSPQSSLPYAEKAVVLNRLNQQITEAWKYLNEGKLKIADSVFRQIDLDNASDDIAKSVLIGRLTCYRKRKNLRSGNLCMALLDARPALIVDMAVIQNKIRFLIDLEQYALATKIIDKHLPYYEKKKTLSNKEQEMLIFLRLEKLFCWHGTSQPEEKILSSLRQLEERFPDNNKNILWTKGELYFRMRYYEAALQYYSSLADNDHILLKKALIQMFFKKYDEAYKHLSKIGNREKILNYLCVYFIDTKKYQELENTFNEMAKLIEKFGMHYSFAQLKKIFSHFLENRNFSNINRMRLFYNRDSVEHQLFNIEFLGHQSQEAKQIRHKLSLDKQLELGRALLGQNDFTSAIHVCETLIQSDQFFPGTYEVYIAALEKDGQLGKAREIFNFCLGTFAKNLDVIDSLSRTFPHFCTKPETLLIEETEVKKEKEENKFKVSVEEEEPDMEKKYETALGGPKQQLAEPPKHMSVLIPVTDEKKTEQTSPPENDLCIPKKAGIRLSPAVFYSVFTQLAPKPPISEGHEILFPEAKAPKPLDEAQIRFFHSIKSGVFSSARTPETEHKELLALFEETKNYLSRENDSVYLTPTIASTLNFRILVARCQDSSRNTMRILENLSLIRDVRWIQLGREFMESPQTVYAFLCKPEIKQFLLETCKISEEAYHLLLVRAELWQTHHPKPENRDVGMGWGMVIRAVLFVELAEEKYPDDKSRREAAFQKIDGIIRQLGIRIEEPGQENNLYPKVSNQLKNWVIGNHDSFVKRFNAWQESFQQEKNKTSCRRPT